MNCDDYCSNYGCNRGKNCPARQSCELPEPPEPDEGYDLKEFRDALIGIAIAVVSVAACLLISLALIPLP